MLPFPVSDETRRPGMRWQIATIIAINILALPLSRDPRMVERLSFPLLEHPHWYQWITSQFMHAGFFHLAGNLWFFWIFGANVEWEMGPWFTPFYLAAGIFANWAQAAFGTSGLMGLGASGAIGGVIGAYMVLFPRGRIRCMALFPTGRYSMGEGGYAISGFLFGFMFIAWQYIAITDPLRHGNVALEAHLGGAIFGAFAALAIRAFRPPPPDLPLSGLQNQKPKPASLWELGPIATALDSNQSEVAIQSYIAAVRQDPYIVLPERYQVMIAEKLATMGWPHLAKDALERQILRYPRSPVTGQAEIWLGFVEETYFRDFEHAEKAFRRGMLHRNASPETKKEAEAKLESLKRYLDKTPASSEEKLEPCRLLLEAPLPITSRQKRRIMQALDGETNLAEGVSFDSGTLLVNVPQPQALRVAFKLERSEVPVAVVPESRVVGLEQPQWCTTIKADGDSVSLYPPGGEAIMLEWKDILLIAGMGLAKEAFRVAPMKSVLGIEVEEVKTSVFKTAATGDDPPGEEELPDVQPVLEIVAADGGRFRWSPDVEDGDEGDEKKDYFEGLEALLLKALNVPISPGAQAALHQSIPDSVIFKSPADLDAHMEWQIQLANLRYQGAYGSWAKRAQGKT